MNTLQISIRDLHARTGHFVRKAASAPIVVTDNGKAVAEISPISSDTVRIRRSTEKSYWAWRQLDPEFRKLMESGALKPKRGGTPLDEILDEIRADSTA
jgi:antitoxin (DNA-binding transcriptional repressor) of toxin-antitoxin stability system